MDPISKRLLDYLQANDYLKANNYLQANEEACKIRLQKAYKRAYKVTAEAYEMRLHKTCEKALKEVHEAYANYPKVGSREYESYTSQLQVEGYSVATTFNDYEGYYYYKKAAYRTYEAYRDYEIRLQKTCEEAHKEVYEARKATRVATAEARKALDETAFSRNSNK